MEVDMKASGKMIKSMAKVGNKEFTFYFIDINLLWWLKKGKYFENNGSRYEGEWKDNKKHG